MKWSLICTNLNLPYQRELCANQVWLKLYQWFCRRKILNIDDAFSLLYPLEKVRSYREFTSFKDGFWQIWSKLAHEF